MKEPAPVAKGEGRTEDFMEERPVPAFQQLFHGLFSLLPSSLQPSERKQRRNPAQTGLGWNLSSYKSCFLGEK